MTQIDPIPEHFQKLITEVRNNHESMGGEQRGALAEIQVRSILATNRASDVYLLAAEKISEVYRESGQDLKKATAGLRTATWALVIVTLGLGVFTYITRSQ